MSHPNESYTPFESKFPELRVPHKGWESNIPPSLLDGADPQMIWLMNEMSKNTQATDFSCRGVEKISDHLRELNGKVSKSATKIEDSKADIQELKDKAEIVSPFLKPISMFATLWQYTLFRWFFIGGIIFFLFVLYPYYLKTASASQLFTMFLGGGG